MAVPDKDIWKEMPILRTFIFYKNEGKLLEKPILSQLKKTVLNNKLIAVKKCFYWLKRTLSCQNCMYLSIILGKVGEIRTSKGKFK